MDIYALVKADPIPNSDPLSPTLTWHRKRPLKTVNPAILAPRFLLNQGEAPSNLLIEGDNLAAMAELLKTHQKSVALAYLDPPFDSKANYAKKLTLRTAPKPKTLPISQVQYTDTWESGAYLQFIYERLVLIRLLLEDTGSIIMHCDRHSSHHLRSIADEVFGAAQFRGQIAWCYGGGGAPTKQYPAKHDTLLWYSKSENWTFNKQFRPYSEGTQSRGLTQVKGPNYALSDKGAMLNDWWAEPEVQKILSPTAYENLKYPTQKPLGLLKRICLGHSNDGDLVLDCFAGSGTTLAAALQCDRRFIGIDANPGAISTTLHRLLRCVGADATHPPLELWTDQARLQSSNATPSFVATLADNTLQINDYEHPRLSDLLAATSKGDLHWRHVIDSVLIDPAYDGSVFRPTICDVPDLRHQIKGQYNIPQPQGEIRVCITDVAAHRTVFGYENGKFVLCTP